MTSKERELALYCLKASSDYHSEVCENCINYPNCDHTIQDDVTETIIEALEQEPKTGHWFNSKVYDNFYICSECGESGYNTFKYCPDCGTKMKVGD